MVKLKSPFASQFASGTLGRELQYAITKRGAVGGRRRRPKQPRTLAQRATRTFMTWLTKTWQTLSPADLATWLNAPNPKGLPLYNIYLSYNLNRIKRLIDIPHAPFHLHALPSMTYPATETGDWGWWTAGTQTPLSHAWRWDRNVGSLKEQWGMIYFTGDAPMYRPLYNILIAIETVTTPGAQSITIADLPAGDITINLMQFTKSGNSPTYLNHFHATILD